MYECVSEWVTETEELCKDPLLPKIHLTFSYKWIEGRGDTKSKLVVLVMLSRMFIYFRIQLSSFGYYMYHVELGLLSKGLNL